MAIIYAKEIAAELHEDWRKTRLTSDGIYEPRWKKIKDEEFIKNLPENLPEYIRVNEGVYEIDIANCSYNMLSADWQAENKAAGEVVAKILKMQRIGAKLTIEEIGSFIHNEWLKRNEWAKGGELDVPFTELSKEEQDKDLNQYYIGVSKAAELKKESEKED